MSIPRALALGFCICLGATGCLLPGVHPVDQPLPDPAVWPQYRLEPSHRGVAPEGTTLEAPLVLLWKSAPLDIGTYSASKSSPAVDEDHVYIGSDDGRLHALDRDTGDIVWSFHTRIHERELERPDTRNRGIHGSPAVDQSRVYIGDYAGWLYAVDRLDGSAIWEKRLGHSIGASPVLYGGYVFIAVEYVYPNGKVFVVDAGTGRVCYQTPFLGNHPHSSVSIDAGRGLFFVGANNGLFFCFDFVAGDEVWRVDTKGDIKSTAAVGLDTVYITSWSYRLRAYSILDGTQSFAVTTKNRTMSSPALLDDRVFFGSHDNRLYCADALTGEVVWSYLTSGDIQSSPTVVADSGVVVFGSRDNRLRMLDIETGALVWTAILDDDITSVPVAVGDRLYINDDSGTVWCFVAGTAVGGLCSHGGRRRG